MSNNLNTKHINRKGKYKAWSVIADTRDDNTTSLNYLGGKRKKIDYERMELPKTVNRNVFARFLVITGENGQFTTMSPFAIMKEIKKLVGSVKNVKKMRDGLLVEVENEAQSRKLMSTSKFSNLAVTVGPHRTLNYCKGVVTCRDLLNCTTEEILENLKEEGVIDAKRITTKRSGEIQNTASLILTFDTPSLPESIKVAMYSLRVRRYIPAPSRCFRCQRYGHFASSCKGEQVCVCGKPPHEGQQCVFPFTCVNCRGNHISSSKNCPIYQDEFAIQKLRVENNMTYGEAKRNLRPRLAASQKSFADAVRSQDTPSNIDPVVSSLLPKLIKAFDAHIEQAMKTIRTTIENQNKASQNSYTPETPSEINTPSKSGTEASINKKKTTCTPEIEQKTTKKHTSTHSFMDASQTHNQLNENLPNIHSESIASQSKPQTKAKESPSEETKAHTNRNRISLETMGIKEPDRCDIIYNSANSSGSDEEMISRQWKKPHSTPTNKDWKSEYSDDVNKPSRNQK